MDFKNTVIILTSNVGSTYMLNTPVDEEGNPLDDVTAKGIKREMVMEAVRAMYRPEFVNRLDEFIMFNPLGREQIREIVRLQVRARSRLGLQTGSQCAQEDKPITLHKLPMFHEPPLTVCLQVGAAMVWARSTKTETKIVHLSSCACELRK